MSIVNDGMDVFIAYAGLIGISGTVACLLIIITVAFPKIRALEKIIAAASLTSSPGQNMWGGDPIGRLMRTTHIFMFLLVRNIPGHFRRAAGNVGNVDAEVPRRLFLWGFLPTLGLFSFGGIAFCVGLIVG